MEIQFGEPQHVGGGQMGTRIGEVGDIIVNSVIDLLTDLLNKQKRDSKDKDSDYYN